MELLVVVPARGGSKGIPNKNIRPLAGKPLLLYTLDVARQIAPDSRILLSTDSPEIAALGRQIGLEVPFLRPAELATDEVGMLPVLQHALRFFESAGKKADVVVLLQPSSPFRTAEHVREALALFSAETDTVVSVMQTKANPYFVLVEEDERGFLQKSKTLPAEVVRRQDAPAVFQLNGAIYLIKPDALRKAKSFADFMRVRKYEMDAVTSVDLDTELDWQFAEFLLHKNNQQG